MAPTDQQKTRSVSMELLILGQCRTGTQSINTALHQLGHNRVYHMRDAMINPEHAVQWIKAFEAKFGDGKLWGQQEWDRILGNYSAVTDIPPAAFPEELIKAYPSAKVILTIREEDTWFNSVKNTIWKGWKMDKTPPGPLRSMLEALHKYLWRDDFETYGREYFQRQNDLVRKLMADREDDFLEYNVKEGWGPLCQFLGKEVPQEGFPRKDAWAQFKKDQEGKSAVDGVTASTDVHE